MIQHYTMHKAPTYNGVYVEVYTRHPDSTFCREGESVNKTSTPVLGEPALPCLEHPSLCFCLKSHIVSVVWIPCISLFWLFCS